jgi:adenosylcobinamide-GDP ribazoletransferase
VGRIRGNVTEQSGLRRMLSEQLNLVRLALGFMTRLPVGQTLDYSPDNMHSALRYFPLAGWVLALLLVVLWSLVQPLLGNMPSVCLLLVASLLFTGALHEDGLADCFDGFYGGFDTERKLTIMKDSRLGTYGSSALFLALLFKFSVLLALAQQQLLITALLLAYPLSRALAITHAQDLPYVTAPGKSKIDPLARPLSLIMLVQLLVIGGIGLLWLPLKVVLLILLAITLLRRALKHWMYSHIQGFTGDCLGAAQQLQELLIYCLLLAAANLGWLSGLAGQVLV